MHTFYLVRHAQSLGNAGVPNAGPNPGLSALGQLQAKALARAVAAEVPVAEIWSSPFARAVETACAVAQTSGASVRLEPQMHEFFFDDWFDLEALRLPSLTEVAAQHPSIALDRDDARWWPREPEDYPGLYLRLEQVAHRLLNEARPGLTLIVGHGASVAALTRALVPTFDPRIEVVHNASITEIRHADDECEIVRFNDTAHLVGC